MIGTFYGLLLMLVNPILSVVCRIAGWARFKKVDWNIPFILSKQLNLISNQLPSLKSSELYAGLIIFTAL